ncbi:hypothetical protein HOV56_gp24 [Nitrosopumilus spindle-shaped virus]|uniref:Uncharacterized protein n=1 Tax=Nitrosopumilus spindle-shaped virus TaxID=2508184 RepID=A0A514K2Q6_9VIRU|nr:hypothetical protein HOV56_gp24 [Nitrosopumilus spindle-shaped virus]YP_010772853.1 hypothetical protein QIT54_gp23 [Nitrosopumilus spindle-shaped virus]QDI73913.1 hypothetical protein [Nitrosopumilus spindle-shaped virus]QDI73961.1 hypothetical protein [Nitrosopumilus spindle-shaped virus]
MSKEFSETKIFVSISLIAFSLVLILPEVNAALYPYDETEFTINWTPVSNGVVTYNETSGEATIYSQTVGSTHTFTRVLGNDFGASASVAASCTPSSNCVFRDISVRGGMIGLGWGDRTAAVGPGSAYYKFRSLNLTDNTSTSTITNTCSIAGGNTLYHGDTSMFNLDKDHDYEVVMAGRCNLSGSANAKIINANGTVYYSSGGGEARSGGWFGAIGAQQILFENETLSALTTTPIVTHPNFNACNENYCGALDSNGDFTYINFGFETDFNSYTAIAPEIQVYRQGYNATSDINNIIDSSAWVNNIYDHTLVTPVVSLSNSIVGENLPTAMFLFTSEGNDYVGKFTTTGISYALLSDFDFTNKALQTYVADDVFGNVGTQSSTTVLPEVYFSLETPSGIIPSNSSGFFALVSGYSTTVPTIVSSVNPSHTNYNTILPFLVTPLSPVTTLIVDIQNIDNANTVVVLKNTDTLLGERYIWDTITLDATSSFTVDLPSNECVEIFVHDGSTNPGGAEETLGTLCASGTMPKEIIYSANLAFTFWTLPFGASHTFSQTGDILTTRVRSDTAPFDYTVKVYHSNGTLYNSTTYSNISTNATTFDLRTFNSSGADYPSRIEILDDNGNIAYYATIGFPNYFSSISSYFAQWFVVEGFNLLYMLPIVFAAMFTRNTVGIGTGLTVVFISVLAWTGLIAIDEIVVYLMIFIAVIGLLAYRTLR